MFPISFIPLCIYICRYLHTYLFPSFFHICYLDVLIILNISIPIYYLMFPLSLSVNLPLSLPPSPPLILLFSLSLSHLSISPSYAHGFTYVSILSKFLKFRSDSHTYVKYIIYYVHIIYHYTYLYHHYLC